MIDLNEVLKFAEKLCREKGDYLLRVWEDIGPLEFHDTIDFSTKYDLSVEREVYKEIKNKYPTHGFLGEEDSSLVDKSSEYIWYVDPIDGTKYFGRQVPLFTTIMGLTYKDEPLVGVVYNPSSKQLYSAAKGVGAFLNGKEFKINDTVKSLKDSIMALELGDENRKWEDDKISKILFKGG